MRVAVGMSGGVDSSVAALLVKERGYEVIGVTLRFHTLNACGGEIPPGVCCSPEDVRDAARVSQKLGIPHITFDWERIFREKVIDPFVRDYSSGKTPNPCAICNREVKTGYFARYLRKVADIDRLVTGHYARIEETPSLGRVIKRAKDLRRDQSYFLALLRKEDLDLLEFPLGSLTKDEVRNIARTRGFEVADKRDSQEVCFLMGKSPGEYLSEVIGVREGPIRHVSGKILGKHRGVFNYTIGQRRGLGISHPRPLYVVELDPLTNTVVVGEEEYLYSDTILTEDLNLHVPTNLWRDVVVQIRYRQKPVPLESIEKTPSGFRVKLREKVKGVAPGQIAAFYEGDVLLGGAVIKGRIEEKSL